MTGRAASLLVVLSLFARRAPYQCARSPDANVREETPGEALYRVAQKLRAEGDVQGWRTTLRYLVEHYPSSRFAVAARADLAEDASVADAP